MPEEQQNSLGGSSRAFRLILIGMILVAIINLAVGLMSFPWEDNYPDDAAIDSNRSTSSPNR